MLRTIALSIFAVQSATMSAQPATPAKAATTNAIANSKAGTPATQPGPADSVITAALRERGLVVATWITPARYTGDFNGDGKQDVATLVEQPRSHKRGVLIVHGANMRATLVGAGVNFGNGGDDFEWADKWSVQKSKGKPDALLVVRQESGGGIIEFVSGKYRWRQHGD